MKIRFILPAALVALTFAPTISHAKTDEEKAERRFHKKFREVVQPVQFDGDYSPSSYRQAEPEVTPTTPVRFVPAWKRAIPVLVKPAPRYVDATPPANSRQQNQAQVPTQNFQQGGSDSYLTSSNLPEAGSDEAAAVVATPGSGSATGSTSFANYGAGLPSTGAAPTVP